MQLFRDFATSPLFYAGISVNAGFTGESENARRNGQFRIDYLFSAARDELGATRSKQHVLFFDYKLLYRIPIAWSDKWNLKAGGIASITGDIRYNPSLQNNGLGFEFFGNIQPAVKLTRDISRTAPRPRHILFVKYGRKVKSRNLSFQLNGGLVNMNYRNGFAYTGQSEVINDLKWFDRYELHLNGLRFGSTLALTRYFRTGNAFRLAYCWEAMRTAPGKNSFEFSSHTVRFTLLFRTR